MTDQPTNQPAPSHPFDARLPTASVEALQEAYAQLPNETLLSARADVVKARGDSRAYDAEITRRGLSPARDRVAEAARGAGVATTPTAEAYQLQLPASITEGLNDARVSGIKTELTQFAREIALSGDRGTNVLNLIGKLSAELRDASAKGTAEDLAGQWKRQSLNLFRSEEKVKEVQEAVKAMLGKSPGDMSKGLQASVMLLNPFLLTALHHHVQALALVDSRRPK